MIPVVQVSVILTVTAIVAVVVVFLLVAFLVASVLMELKSVHYVEMVDSIIKIISP